MSGVVKAVKKVVKGVGKAVKSVVKGVVKVAKKVVSTVGKVMGKLGPIGSIAIGMIAPYAIGAMAGSTTGWVSAIGKGLQTVGKVISAPMNALKAVGGNLLGSAASGLSPVAGKFGLDTISG